MSNHLSHRWPQGEPRPIHYHYTSDRRPRRLGKALLVVSLCLVAAAALVFGGYLGMVHLANSLADAQRGSFAPRPSSHVEVNANWDPADLPWAQPDPNVSIFVHDQDTQVLTSNQIYDQVLPSVVCVTADQGNGSASVGSGVVLTQSGYIVTNFHIIQGGVSLNVSMLSSTANYDAKLVGYDEELDLAVLKIEAQGLTPARLGSSDQLSVGDSVYAIGNPMGYLHGTMTEGIISSPTRTIPVDGKDMNLLQTSAALNSGNSGGALTNAYGQVVGITSAKITGLENDTVIEGLGLVIPINDTIPFLNQMIHTGQSFRPSLGILCQEVQMDDTSGVYVVSTTADTPAHEALLEGDVILAANGVDTPTLYALTRVLNDTGVGNQVELSVLRDGGVLSISITLYDRLT
ncbi:trypsin-like peptidase domain-containing protein [Pseudoflavonifractor capillosus]|uniref:trypsin-like peptidase domain-containing protein n=1 Tax=Pseudoflavonifractor capillosus TaxID=106588 RepID=UPI00195824B4|nr:trypsin-like peptidase domain-containing protein [Pseudoflavonifractor capillosus]